MSIKIKLFLIAIIYSIFLVCLLWYENITLKNFNNLKDTKESIKQLHISMLTLRRNEKDFLLRQKIRYVDKFKQNSSQIDKNIHRLKEFLTQNNIDTTKLKKFDAYIKDYKKYFLVLVEQYKLNGLNTQEGLIKEFNKSMKRLETDLQTKYFDEILTLRVYEKNFLITNNIIYLDNYKSQISKLLKLLPKDKIKYLKAYEKSFLQFANGKILIGLNEELGIKGEMRNSVHQTEILLDELTKEFEQLVNKKIESIETNRTIMISLLIIFSVSIIFFQLYNITVSIFKLEDGLESFFKYLNKEKSTVELLEIKSNDEIGKMSKSINENILNTSKRLEDERIRFEKELAFKTKALIDLNNELEQRVKDEVEKNMKKQIQLIEQSKMASLGSMIGNIIHQWRQPLSQISLLASSVRLNISMAEVEKNKLDKDMKSVLDRVKYMNEVLITFRNFVMEKKEKKEVSLQDRIDKALSIVQITLKDVHIDLKKSINYDEEIKVILVVGELEEVIINIINNAKDALIENEIESPWIKVDLIKQNNKAIITIEDNAKGIPLDVLPHIFEENFTTKDKDIGTGLGLFMSHEIITKSLSGKFYCQNSDNGAKFFIEIPLI